MTNSAIFGIVLGIVCALPILILATQNVIIGFLATLCICCCTVCVIGVIPLAGWKLGVSLVNIHKQWLCFELVSIVEIDMSR